MANFRNGYIQRNQPMGQVITSVSLKEDNVNIITDGIGFIKLYSDSTTATDRTFTLESSTLLGHELTIVFYSGASATCELANSGNVILTANWTPTQYGTIQLVWDGDHWVEIYYR